MNPIRRRFSGGPARPAWGRAIILRIALFLGTVLPGVPLGAGAAREDQIKAAFVYNFIKYVEWPADHFAGTTQPIVLGVLGRDAFADALEAAVDERKIGGRRLVVRRLAGTAGAGTEAVDLLFVCAGEEARFNAARTALRDAGVLTVGESERFAELGGAITFVVLEDRLRFEINASAAEAGGLRISAQLQKLSVPARRKP